MPRASRPRSGDPRPSLAVAGLAPAGSIEPEFFAVQERVQRYHWWYRGRRALLRRLVPRLLPSDRRGRILDLGCGVGVNARLLARHGSPVLVDESPVALARARAVAAQPCLQGDALRLPFRAGAFDLACALDVLEHLPDDRGALRELARVLAPGGRLLVLVPAFGFLWGPQDRVSRHVRRYRRGELVARVREAGFHVERAWYFNCALFLPILVARKLLDAVGRRERSENELTPGLANRILERWFARESRLSLGVSFPFGVSLALVATAPRP